MCSFAWQGVYAFWAATPVVVNESITMHWIAPGPEQLVFRKNDQRCILISSGQGRADRMYAHLRPCNAKLADGLLTTAAAAAPPPPPGNAGGTHYFDPTVNPPPPPSIEQSAWDIWKRTAIRPRTDAICNGGVVGIDRENLCVEMMEYLAKWQPIPHVGLRAPLCHSRICWHRCDGSHTGGDDDGYTTCKSVECAQENCYNFLKAECAPVTHAHLDLLYGQTCTLTPPSPPRPPGPPPSPPAPPYSPPPGLPPPAVFGSIRAKADEKDWEDNCTMVPYADCKEKVRQYALAHGTIDSLRISQAPCEGLKDEQACFVGCQFGGETGGQYTFLLPDVLEEFAAFNKFRCKYAMHPFCLCGNAAPPPPFVYPPPPPLVFTEDWEHVAMPPQTDAFRGKISAMVKRISNGRMIDPALRSSAHTVYCPGKTDCRDGCARACARQSIGKLRAFSVVGTNWVRDSPPPPSPPPPGASPPDPPYAPFSVCTDTCEPGPIPDHRVGQCRDGGYNSYYPTLCQYSSECSRCGPRDNKETVTQDNNCATARNGVCEDGGFGSNFYVDREGLEAHLCGYGSDFDDCVGFGERFVFSYGYESYQGITNITYPLPPPPPPHPPPNPAPPPNITWTGCTTGDDVCYSFFVYSATGTGDFACSGTKVQLWDKVNLGICDEPSSYTTRTPDGLLAAFQSTAYTPMCSDGGFDSIAVRVGSKGVMYPEPTFGCDYGSSCSQCGQTRPYLEQIPCQDTCGIGTNNDIVSSVFPDDAVTQTLTNGDTIYNGALCRDGGPDAASATCAFATQCSRCGVRSVIYTSLEQRRGLSGTTSGTNGNGLYDPLPRFGASPPPPPPPARRHLDALLDTLRGWRRRMQNAEDLNIAPSPPPPPPPPPPGNKEGWAAFKNPRPPPSPLPPPPPPLKPPPLPPPSPNPPPHPPGYYEYGKCSCYDEDTDDADSNNFGWSEIELRAKSNVIEPTAITYAARATLVRGKAVATDPIMWVPGGDALLGQHVQKWVSDASVAGDVAHIVDGYKHPGREDQLLETIPLEAYRWQRPTWWPPNDETWRFSPNNSESTSFWASVCMSSCIRDHNDIVNIVLVDLLSANASCNCYAWEDTNGVDHNASHSAPSDAQLMDWMHDSVRVVDALADSSEHAKLATYAVHKRPGKDYYSDALQSTIYYSQVLTNDLTFKLTGFGVDNIAASAAYSPATLEDCFYQCFKTLNLRTNSIIWTPAHVDTGGVAQANECWCVDERLEATKYGHRWRINHHNRNDEPVVYSVRLCTNVRASDDRSMIYTRSNDGFCPGVPIVTGYTLATHSLLTVGAAGADEFSTPFDVRCRKLCVEDEQCGIAHIYASTFAYQDLVNRCAAFQFNTLTFTNVYVCLFAENHHRPRRHCRPRRRRRHSRPTHRCLRRLRPKSALATACGFRARCRCRCAMRCSTSLPSAAPWSRATSR